MSTNGVLWIVSIVSFMLGVATTVIIQIFVRFLKKYFLFLK